MKSLLKKIISCGLGLYFIGASMVFTPYNNWTYFKHHGFIKWLLLGDVVVTAKALVWPYFIVRSILEGRGRMPSETQDYQEKHAGATD